MTKRLVYDNIFYIEKMAHTLFTVNMTSTNTKSKAY